MKKIAQVKVKICGITNLPDALKAVYAGADTLGFVFYRQSPRYITPSHAGHIIDILLPLVTTVGVFVDPTMEYLRQVIKKCRLDYIQLHGDETPTFCQKVRRKFKVKIIKAFRVKDKSSLTSIGQYKVDAYLLDTYHKNKPGGTGLTFDWRLAKGAKINRDRLIVAGGLTPENVRRVARNIRPWAVDVAGGVEKAPGKKDPAKIKKFIRAAKQRI
jgi:phosphoribosylanthranilate isomerase